MSQTKKKAKPKPSRRPVLYVAIALAVVLIGYVLWVRLRVLPPDGPADLLPKILEEQGFLLNEGLTDLYQPGDVIQVAEDGGDGSERRLAAPLPYLRAADCFPGLAPRRSPFALPTEAGGDASAGLRMGVRGLARFLPGLGLDSSAAARYRLELDDPHLLAASPADLSRRFSAECVARLNEARADGRRLEWLVVVHQVVVADGFRLELDSSTATSAEARVQAEKATRKALAQGGELAVSGEGTEKKSYALGRTVLGYKTRPLAPLVRGAVAVPADAAPDVDRASTEPAGTPLAIRGRLTVLAVEGRTSRAVGLGHGFRTGDWFRFSVRAERGGWLYVFHREPGGELALLWPPPDASGANELAAGVEAAVPPRPRAWRFVETTGEEYFYVAITSEPRPPEAATPTAEPPAKVVNYIVRGLARNVELGTVPEESEAPTDVEIALVAAAAGDGTVAAVELRLRHEPRP